MNPRRPTTLRIIEGNPGKRALPTGEPQPEVGAEPPEWLSPLAAAHWPMIAKQLTAVGVLTKMDVTALGLYCESFAIWKDANDKVVKKGTVVLSPTKFPMQSPYLAIANRAHDQMVRLLMEFGMTPAARSRVQVAKATSAEEKTGLKKYL